MEKVCKIHIHVCSFLYSIYDNRVLKPIIMAPFIYSYIEYICMCYIYICPTLHVERHYDNLPSIVHDKCDSYMTYGLAGQEILIS